MILLYLSIGIIFLIALLVGAAGLASYTVTKDRAKRVGLTYEEYTDRLLNKRN